MLVSVFSILVAVNYGDHLKKLKSSLIIYFLRLHAINHSNDDDHYFNMENKKEKLGSKWGEMMSTEKPLVRIRRKNKALKEQKNSENKDSLEDKEKKLEDLKKTLSLLLGKQQI